MELRHLRYFVAVAEELSFTRAAQRLHIAQPPLSTQIKALEEELKVRLFDRDKRHVYLTQAGRHFLERVRAILADVQVAGAEARSAESGEIGKLAVGYTASSMLSLALPAALREFRDRHPTVAIKLNELSSLEQLEAVHARELDIGILRKPGVLAPPGVVIEEWQRAPLIAVVPRGHPLSRKDAIRIHELKGQPLIMYPRQSGIGLYWKVHELCAAAGFRPEMAQEARDASTIVGLAAAGVGIAIVPQDTQCIRLDGVNYLRLLDKEAVSTLHLSYRSADDNAHVALLRRTLKAAVRNTRLSRA